MTKSRIDTMIIAFAILAVLVMVGSSVLALINARPVSAKVAHHTPLPGHTVPATGYTGGRDAQTPYPTSPNTDGGITPTPTTDPNSGSGSYSGSGTNTGTDTGSGSYTGGTTSGSDTGPSYTGGTTSGSGTGTTSDTGSGSTNTPSTDNSNTTTSTNTPVATAVPSPTGTTPASGSPTATTTSTATSSPTVTATDTPTATVTSTSTATATDTPIAITTPTPCTSASCPATALLTLQQVTDQAFVPTTTVPSVANGWGVQKSRIVHASKGDLFTVYISTGTGDTARQWHLLHKAPASTDWKEIDTSKLPNAGREPINILCGLNDELHIFVWPDMKGTLHDLVSTDLGKTFKDNIIPGQWAAAQGYSGSSINSKGDIVVFQTGGDTPTDTPPSEFLWAYYSSTTQKWTSHITTLPDYRYTYAFFFPGDHNDLTIVGMRDVKREDQGYTKVAGFDYIFNAIRYYYIPDVTASTLQITSTDIVSPQKPINDTNPDVIYLTDVYMDTNNLIHILYSDSQNVFHHVVFQRGSSPKDIALHVTNSHKARITQDASGRFYIISMDDDGKHINVYPGASGDTDGTQLSGPIQLDISAFPGCTDDDLCHEPTFTIPRVGDALSNTIDGVYGNNGKEIYFSIKLS